MSYINVLKSVCVEQHQVGLSISCLLAADVVISRLSEEERSSICAEIPGTQHEYVKRPQPDVTVL